ncbi:MAG: hypothetical protein DDG60_16515 [Anaerolineae bacterium]|nr:MAG: hypothetical protein DDG60_16515 [Anaerolineae bacterium]
MTLAAYLAVISGILIEILLLWEAADRRNTLLHPSTLVAPSFNRLQQGIALFALIAWLAITLAEFFKPSVSASILAALQSAVMAPTFAFLFIFGMVSPKLLPRVNEQTIVTTSLVTFYSLLSTARFEWFWLAILLLPTLGIFWMGLTSRTMHPYLKSLLYFWYLVGLLIMALQHNLKIFIPSSPQDLNAVAMTNLDYFLGGAAGVFLLLHSIFLVRFFLMLTALIRPANRHLILRTMPRLFNDRQIPPVQFIGLLTFFGAILVLNHFTGILSSTSVLNLLILFAVHFMERPVFLTDRL